MSRERRRPRLLGVAGTCPRAGRMLHGRNRISQDPASSPRPRGPILLHTVVVCRRHTWKEIYIVSGLRVNLSPDAQPGFLLKVYFATKSLMAHPEGKGLMS